MPDHDLRGASDRRALSPREQFEAAVPRQIEAFEGAAMIQRVARGDVRLEHYHALLVTLFHQTRSSPYTFARAAVHCGWGHAAAKEYLLSHAEEERTHWRWILDDLRNTGYDGVDPQTIFPHPTCEAYISFNERIAECAPVARLATACVLEGIGAAFGERYGRKLLQTLGLTAKHASFFLSHGETDKVHANEVAGIIGQCRLSDTDWGWMTHAATMAGQLYKAMYSHEAFAEGSA